MEHGLKLLCGMWDLPGAGVEPVSPALAGRFLTTASPGKSLIYPFNYALIQRGNHSEYNLAYSCQSFFNTYIFQRSYYVISNFVLIF